MRDSLGAAPRRARCAVTRVAVLSQLAGGAFAAAPAPLVPFPVAEIAGVGEFKDDIDERLAAEFLRHLESRGLVDPHERRLDGAAPVHAQAERDLQRLQGVVAA